MLDERKKCLRWLFLLIFVYVMVFCCFSFWKYYHLQYDALDLAIFNQVFYNSAHGQLFSFTIHPHSFLGDHLAFLLILLLPIYWLWQTPYTLLVIQTIFIGLATWPLFLIAQKWLKIRWAFLISCLFLLSSFTHSINLFEFHEISLALPFLFFLFYFYLNKNFKIFLVFIFICLLIREDMALITLAFSLLALLDKRKIKWFLIPFIISLLWIIVGYYLTAYFSGYSSYKFLVYFSYLGQNPKEMAINFFTQPLLTLSHLFTLENALFLIGLLLPFLFIPLLKPRYLILSLPHFLLFCLASFGKMIILNSHYLVFLTFGIWLSFIAGCQKLLGPPKPFWQWLKRDNYLLAILLIGVTLYTSLTLGPLWGMIKEIIRNPNQARIEKQQRLNQMIPDQASLLASYQTITNLSSRPNLYLDRYIFLNRKQYSHDPFPEPEQIDYALFDSNNYLAFQLQYSKDENYQDGAERIRNLIKKQGLKIVECLDSFILLKKDGQSEKTPYQILDISATIKNEFNIKINEQIKLL
ncbi:DUF2079 domain-containing protein, partial [Candidatus Gribaldobacteria bacterium]|nr:DUF2079 domain-containing protein [Candidatus Gribaldobacteria bacterium]